MNPEIEKLIDLALADGEITDKERSVILKKAVKLGEDPDEVEMILDGRLHESKKLKTKEKVGNIKVCPSCGESVKSFQLNCSGCGHEFSNSEGSKSVKKFIEGYKSIKKTFKGSVFNCYNCKKENLILGEELEENKCECYNCGSQNILNDSFKIVHKEKINNYISQYNIPHDKESVLSLLFYFYSQFTNNEFGEFFKSKFLETSKIAKTMLHNEKDLIDQINSMSDEILETEKRVSRNKRYEEIGLYIFISIIMIGVFVMIILDD